MTYGPRGKLQTIVDTLAPTTPTANVMGGTLPNYFVTGGSQVTQFNTGDNPNWQSSWSSQFESVTTSYGSDHQILEQMFLCGSSNHYLVSIMSSIRTPARCGSSTKRACLQVRMPHS